MGHPLLVSDDFISESKLSKEEELLQERTRVRGQGILNYCLDKNTGKIIFNLGSNLYQCHDSMNEVINVNLASFNFLTCHLYFI